MQTVFDSTKQFELHVSFTDTDISLTQECVALATEHPGLSGYWEDAIALTLTMMDAEQRDRFRFERLYPEAVEAVMHGGDEGNPIIVVDEDE
jgi:hypothetical protein